MNKAQKREHLGLVVLLLAPLLVGPGEGRVWGLWEYERSFWRYSLFSLFAAAFLSSPFDRLSTAGHSKSKTFARAEKERGA